MAFDTSIVSVWHLGALLGMFVAIYGIISAMIRVRPASWRVYATGKPLYYAGWVMALCIAALAVFVLKDRNLVLGLVGATCLIVLIGRLDEEKKLSPYRQLFWQMCIAGWAVYFGWEISHVSDPVHGGVLLVPLGGMAAFVWFLLCMNAMNFLDGADGLAVFVGMVACMALAGISMLPATQDATTLALASVGLGGLTAFFLWNAPPARVYLGTSGSWFVGMFLAMTAIIGGGKIATAMIVLAIPVLDALFVVAYRIFRKRAPWKGDRESHIHHRLKARGASSWGMLLLLGGITCALGIVSIMMPTGTKLMILAVFAAIFLAGRVLMMRQA